MPRPRTLSVPVALDTEARLFNAEELHAVLGRLDRRGEIWLALRQVLHTRFAQAAAECSARTLTEREAGFAAGQLAESLEVLAELKRYVETPRGK